MGQIADTLRATLRDLAQSDARLYRGLQGELAESTPSQPSALLEGEDWASREDLEGLSVKVLWGLCKERGIKGLSSGPKPRQIEALLNHPDGPPLRSALPTKVSKGVKASGGGQAASSKASGGGLQQLEQRLDRLELLVLLIAKQVGVPPAAIAQLTPPAALPPT
ncbi:hypothetical protein SynRS9909_01227 [Synechococcus sp. RS9909]|uniref:hypothetical protein n=1 Tax=unclassified Synechococcus TaxID=2626047 RepID=UPI0000690C9E|nr:MULTISPECIES: hypothetical protein [unclassified Synechococcus]EAQ67961.1 hypothetical protein RS9917_13813 [Synechococcus sp. RS9917]QNI79215.1 hypothetical protein SynRS9909_01227 [Synechococcus sp. RS9909]